MIRAVCPSCHATMEYSDFLAGLSVVCRKCHDSILVPNAGQAAEPFAQGLTPQPDQKQTLPHGGITPPGRATETTPQEPVTLPPIAPVPEQNPKPSVLRAWLAGIKDGAIAFGFGLFMMLFGAGMFWLMFAFGAISGKLALVSVGCIGMGIVLIVIPIFSGVRSLLRRKAARVVLGVLVLVLAAIVTFNVLSPVLESRRQLEAAQARQEAETQQVQHRAAVQQQFPDEKVQQLLGEMPVLSVPSAEQPKLRGKVLVVSVAEQDDHVVPTLFPKPAQLPTTPDLLKAFKSARLDSVTFLLPSALCPRSAEEVDTVVCIRWLSKAVGIYRKGFGSPADPGGKKAYQVLATVIVVDRRTATVLANKLFVGGAPPRVTTGDQDTVGPRPMKEIGDYLGSLPHSP